MANCIEIDLFTNTDRSQIHNLKWLVPISTIANIVIIVSYGIIAYYMLREPFTFEGREAFGSAENLPLFFGTVIDKMQSFSQQHLK